MVIDLNMMQWNRVTLVSAWDQEPSLNGEARDGYWSEYDAMKQSELISAWDQESSLNGEACDGYWMSNIFMKQIGSAVKIAEEKYPKEKDYRLLWIFN